MSTLTARPAIRLGGAVRPDDPEIDERELVERAKTDRDALAELYRMYLPRIHAFAYRRTGDRQVA